MREKAAQRLEKMPVGYFSDVTLYRDRITKGAESQPLDNITARIESGSELEKRVTLTRFVALGALSLLAKKRTGGESYLTIEGPEFFWTIEVDRKQRPAAQAFAARLNQAARTR